MRYFLVVGKLHSCSGDDVRIIWLFKCGFGLKDSHCSESRVDCFGFKLHISI